MESWVFLLVGGLGAVGAALSLGTLAAWVRYERTGEVPGQGTTASGTDGSGGMDGTGRGGRGDSGAGDARGSGMAEEMPAPGPDVRRRLLLRVVIGAVVAAVCFVILAQQGLLAGPVPG